MKKTRLLALFLASLMLLTLFAACSNEQSNPPASDGEQQPSQGDGQGSEGAETPDDGITRGGTMVIGQSAEPITLNPDGKPDDNTITLAQNCFNRLLKTNNNQQVILDLATGYEVSEDGKSYTFTLPENVHFHDGETLTSDDVKFTFEQIVAQSGFAANSMSVIESIECPDDLTVVFNLSKVDSGFLGALAYNGTYILPRHVYENQDWLGEDSMQTPVGTGPFKFDGWERGVSMTLVRNDDFYLGADLPYLDKIVVSYISDTNTAMQAFYNHELDVLGVIAPATENDKLLSTEGITAQKTIYPSRFYIGFNMAREPFNDVNFRMAVAHATNADDIVNKALKSIGQKSTTYVSPLYDWACNNDPEAAIPAFDLEKAKEYMTKTGLQPDGDGVYLRVALDTYNYEPFPDMVQVVKEQLGQIGIEVTINMLEYAAWDEKVAIAKDYDMTLTGGYQGPDVSALGDRIVTGAYLNFLNYSNPEVDRLMEEGANLPTFEQRAPKYKEAQAILAKDVPMVIISEWLGYVPYLSIVNNHPTSPEAIDKTAFGEFTYTWIDR